MERNRAVFRVKIRKKIQEKNMPLIAIATLNFKKIGKCSLEDKWVCFAVQSFNSRIPSTMVIPYSSSNLRYLSFKKITARLLQSFLILCLNCFTLAAQTTFHTLWSNSAEVLMLFKIAPLKGSNPHNADPSCAKKLPITQPKAEYLK